MGQAQAKSFSLPQADVTVTVAEDGALEVEERITFSFSGSFSGAFREIPLRRGESLTSVGVEEAGRAYAPGASAELGSSGTPDTYGIASTEKGLRVVWHYRAADESRTFTLRYRLAHLAIAYDDVVDLNLKLWGDEWETWLGHLNATIVLPARPLRAWGHPASVRGTVQLLEDRVVLQAVDVPPGQFVEARILFPRSALGSLGGTQVRSGSAHDRIVAEEIEDARAFERDRERVRSVLGHPARTILLLLALGLLPALALSGGVWLAFGRERASAYEREYEQEPPSELEPALAAALVEQRGSVGAREFTATLFDLIRRGRYDGEPVTTERKTWGGLRSEDVSDLELSLGQAGVATAAWEEPVVTIMDDALRDGPAALSRLGDEIRENRTMNAKRFARFRDGVGSEIKRRRWYANRGLWLLVAGASVLIVSGGILFFAGIGSIGPGPIRWGPLLALMAGIVLGLNGVTLAGAAATVPLWRRREPGAQLEAERWTAFRRFLADFPRLGEAPPASLELWERYLVYGIAFGLAERVLQAAQLHMPEEVHDASSLYWISSSGDLGSGATSLGISDLVSSLGSSLSTPSSGGSGAGGGFSGGGGGGGGGGGAW